jgi:hypothetical protein
MCNFVKWLLLERKVGKILEGDTFECGQFTNWYFPRSTLQKLLE